MDLGLKDKKAIVCASSQGLGYACAVALAQEGAHVWINGRFADKLEDSAENIRTATGNEDGLKALKIMADDGRLTMHWAVGLDVNYFESPYSFDDRMQQIENRTQYASEFVGVD